MINLDHLELLEKEDLINIIKNMVEGGVSINFYGKRVADEIYKRVRPRVTRVNENYV